MRTSTRNKPKARDLLGLTLTEVIVSVAILAVMLSAIFALNSQCMSVMRSKRNLAASSLFLQERVEAFRMAEWGTVTTSAGVSQLLATETNSLAFGFMGIVQPTEKVTVTACDPITGNPSGSSFVATRENGSVSVSGTANISASDTVRLDFELSWNEMGRLVGPRKLTTTLGSYGFSRTAISRKPFEPKAPNS